MWQDVLGIGYCLACKPSLEQPHKTSTLRRFIKHKKEGLQDEQILPVVVPFSQLLCSVRVGSIHITHLSILRSQPKLAARHCGNLPILTMLLAHSTQEAISGGSQWLLSTSCLAQGSLGAEEGTFTSLFSAKITCTASLGHDHPLKELPWLSSHGLSPLSPPKALHG